MKRAAWLAGSGALSAAALAAPAVGQTLRPLAVGQNAASSATWPMMAGTELGFFRRYGLDLQVVTLQSTAAAAQQAIVGAVDLGLVSSTQLVEAVEGGAPLKAYCNQMSTPAYSIVAQKSIKRYADLKAKTIVVGGINDATRIFAEKMIAKGGLKPTDYDETYAGATTDRYAALLSGSVAAAILFPPWDFRAADEGYTMLGNLSAAMPAFTYTGYVGRADLGAQHGDVLTDFAKGYLRAVRWLNDPANRAHALEILIERTRVTADDARRTYDEVIAQQKIFPGDGRMNDRMLEVVLDMLGDLKLIKPPYPAPGKYYDNRFVDAANAQLARERG